MERVVDPAGLEPVLEHERRVDVQRVDVRRLEEVLRGVEGKDLVEAQVAADVRRDVAELDDRDARRVDERHVVELVWGSDPRLNTPRAKRRAKGRKVSGAGNGPGKAARRGDKPFLIRSVIW